MDNKTATWYLVLAVLKKDSATKLPVTRTKRTNHSRKHLRWNPSGTGIAKRFFEKMTESDDY